MIFKPLIINIVQKMAPSLYFGDGNFLPLGFLMRSLKTARFPLVWFS